MDCKTPEGRKYMKHAERAVEIFNSNTGFKFVATDPDSPATLDGIIVTKGIVNGVVEIKAREETFIEMLDYDNPKGLVDLSEQDTGRQECRRVFLLPILWFPLLYPRRHPIHRKDI